MATTVISLALMVIVGLQSCAVSFGASIDADEELGGGAAVGILVALLFLVGGAFAIAYPLVSVVSFAIAGLFGFAAGATTEFMDMTIWGAVSLVLAVMSFFGWREKRKRRQEGLRG